MRPPSGLLTLSLGLFMSLGIVLLPSIAHADDGGPDADAALDAEQEASLDSSVADQAVADQAAPDSAAGGSAADATADVSGGSAGYPPGGKISEEDGVASACATSAHGASSPMWMCVAGIACAAWLLRRRGAASRG